MKYYSPLTDTIKQSIDFAEWLIPIGDPPSEGPNTSFEGSFQTHWDSVSISAFKTCPRYYNWSIRLGYQLDPQPSTLAFGIYFHKSVEVWHKLLALGMEKETAILRVTRLAGLLGELLIPDRTERTKETLIRCVVWYLIQFWDDHAETMKRPDGTPAVEYSFTIPLKLDHPERIGNKQTYLCGHLDRVVIFMGQLYLCDYKTTKGQLNEKFFDSFKPNTQVEGYLAAAHVISAEPNHPVLPKAPKGLIIDGAQLGVNYNRFFRQPVQYSKLEINSFLADLEHWLAFAYQCAENEHWPANETACDRYGGCVFRSICSETPAKHERMLNANFKQRVWDPRKSR